MFAYCLNNPVNGCDPCGTCFHRWDFWNDCEKCGGRNLGEKAADTWQDFTTWCVESYDHINNVHQQQIQMQTELVMQQNKLIADAAKALWDAHVHSVELEAQAQYKQDMTTRKAVTILVENPAMTANLAINLVGIGVSLVGCYSALGLITIPATANIVLSGVGLGCSLWGGGDAIGEFLKVLYE